MKFIALILFLLVSLPAHADEVYDRVMDSGKIRCGYAVWDPFLIKDPNTGNLSGIYYDYMQALGKALSLDVEWVEETSFGPHVEGLRNNRFDMMCAGDWPSAARARFIDYPTPILYVAIKAYARADDTRFDNNLDRINSEDVTIATVEGSTPFIIAHQAFPKAKKIDLPELSDLSMPLLEVAGNKADVAFWAIPNARAFLANNPAQLKEVESDKPIKLYASSLALKKGEDKMRQMITFATYELLYSGVIDEIIDRYEKHPGSFYRVAKPYEVPR